MLKSFGAAGTGLLAGGGPLAAAQETARKGMPPLKITDVKVILTQPASDHLVIVKVMTNEPGLYGVGCATHRERPLAVAAAIEQYLKPCVAGRNCDEIEDIWQSAYVASYFRSGVTLNNALSGIDGALWDILGKRCNVPVYKLLGGKVRAAVPLYCHASARDFSELEDQVRQWMSQGYRYVRVHQAVPGFAGYALRAETSAEVQKMRPDGIAPSPVFEPTPYVNNTIKMFEQLRVAWASTSSCSMTFTSACRPTKRSSGARRSSLTGRSSWKIPFPLKTSPGFAFSGRRPRARSPWASSS
jgi:mannonate dehydratase